jgi:hypothetical protein
MPISDAFSAPFFPSEKDGVATLGHPRRSPTVLRVRLFPRLQRAATVVAGVTSDESLPGAVWLDDPSAGTPSAFSMRPHQERVYRGIQLIACGEFPHTDASVPRFVPCHSKRSQVGNGTGMESTRFVGQAPPPTSPHNVAGFTSIRCQNICAGNVAGREGHVTPCERLPPSLPRFRGLSLAT